MRRSPKLHPRREQQDLCRAQPVRRRPDPTGFRVSTDPVDGERASAGPTSVAEGRPGGAGGWLGDNTRLFENARCGVVTRRLGDGSMVDAAQPGPRRLRRSE